MELKTFISTALTQIVEGIVEAQKAAGEHDAYVNPGGLSRSGSLRNFNKNPLWDNSNSNFARTVMFDVAVTVEEESHTRAKIGVVSGLLNAGAGGESGNKEVAFSRIRFSVPVLLPPMPVAERGSRAHEPEYNIG
jgi:hypothetical protein